MTELVEQTLREAGELIANRQSTSRELTEAILRRIEETEPSIHAYAHVLTDRALEAADEADREIAAGYLRGPLHGVPIAIKDIVYMRGVPTEAGSRVLAGHIPSYDATIIKKLDQAGAVIVGKTVTMEFAWGTNVPVTRNPWRDGYYPGGSSAGSGVSVAVRSAFGAIGTDSGGSVRIPAAINGLVGLKPTFGRISRHGVFPLAWSLDHIGTLTRTVEDAAIMLQAIAGHDAADRGSIDEPVSDYCADLRDGADGLVIGVERAHHFYHGVVDDVREAVEGVINEYAQVGARIVEVDLPEFDVTPAVLLTILLAEASAVHRSLLRAHADEYDQSTRLMLELGELIPATHYLTALRARTLVQRRIRALYEEHRLDVLLAPTIPMPAVPNELRTTRLNGGEAPSTSYIHHTFSANLSGLPALSIPCGLTSDGLPIGYQLLGRPFDEAALFRLAHAYECEHCWPDLQPPAFQSANPAELRSELCEHPRSGRRPRQPECLRAENCRSVKGERDLRGRADVPASGFRVARTRHHVVTRLGRP